VAADLRLATGHFGDILRPRLSAAAGPRVLVPGTVDLSSDAVEGAQFMPRSSGPIPGRRSRAALGENRMPSTSFDSLVARVRGEYCEMPGLRLTVSQACRLWHVDVSTCEMLFEQLVLEGFLYKTEKSAYIAQPTTRKRIWFVTIAPRIVGMSSNAPKMAADGTSSAIPEVTSMTPVT
jgi:hypothetical protein